MGPAVGPTFSRSLQIADIFVSKATCFLQFLMFTADMYDRVQWVTLFSCEGTFFVFQIASHILFYGVFHSC